MLSPDGSQAVAVENGNTTMNTRTYSGYEGALTVSFSKAYDLKNKTYQVAFDYKHQATDLGLGNPFTVNTLIGSADFNPPVSGFDSLLLSASYERAQASGDEYVQTTSGNPPTLATFPFYLDTASLGSYSYIPLDITRTSWAFGLLYPLTSDINVRSDYFINEYTWKNAPAAFANYYRRDQI